VVSASKSGAVWLMRTDIVVLLFRRCRHW
jgi:hypothetical protein